MTPTPTPLRRIVLATDLGADAPELFADALGLALRAHTELLLLHVADPTHPEASWRRLPTVRQLLERWKVLPADASYEDFERLDIHVRILERSPTDGDVHAAVTRRVAELEPDLVLLGTGARNPLAQLGGRSVAEAVARDVHRSTLLLPYHARGLVIAETGELRLARVVVPVTAAVPQAEVIDQLTRVLTGFRATPVAITLVHVGDPADLPAMALPGRTDWTWKTDHRTGNVVDGILEAAVANDADLIAMATHGHDSFLDALQGSVMERVLRKSPCAVLAVRV